MSVPYLIKVLKYIKRNSTYIQIILFGRFIGMNEASIPRGIHK